MGECARTLGRARRSALCCFFSSFRFAIFIFTTAKSAPLHAALAPHGLRVLPTAAARWEGRALAHFKSDTPFHART